MTQLYLPGRGSCKPSSEHKINWLKQKLLCLFTACIMLSGDIVAQAQSDTFASSPIYTSTITTSIATEASICSGDKFTLTLTNVSAFGNSSGPDDGMGSVILKLPAGLTMADIASIEVSDAWTIYQTANPAEVRLKAHDNMTNVIPAKGSGQNDNKLTISLSVMLTTASRLSWETIVFTNTHWKAAGSTNNSDFQLVGSRVGVTTPSKIYPVANIQPKPVVTLASSDSDNSICAGEPITFTAGTSNGVTISSYEFLVDGQSKQQGKSNTFQAVISDGQKVSVQVNTASGCRAAHAGIVTRVHAAPVAVFTSDTLLVCPDGAASLPISLSGKAPWLINYKINGKPAQLTVNSADVKSNVYNLNIKPSINTIYELLSVSDAGGCVVSASGRTIVVIAKPVVLVKQPQSQEVCEKEQAIFAVSAEGTEITYQWRKNGLSIPGATASNYILQEVALSDHSASFDVVISGFCGSVTSSPVVLVVNQLTAIHKQPLSLEICENLKVNLAVEAIGTQLSYQWYKGVVDEDSLIKEAIRSVYTISQVSMADAGKYIVVVKGLCGEVNSYPATLIVNPKPVFGRFAFIKDGIPLQEPSVEINSNLSIEISLRGKELEHLHYTLIGHGKSVPLFPEYNFKTGKLTAYHQFTAAQTGVYLLTASATNNCGTSITSHGYVVVYYPDASLVKGSGSVTSPLNTRCYYMASAGKADYRFEAHYKPGTSEVEGQVEYDFQKGAMQFKSTSLDRGRLVVSGNIASLQGKGTINGRGNYAFMLSAIDGGDNYQDKLRMMIWELQPAGTIGKLVFDNQEKRGDGLEIQPGNTISGGSVSIQKAADVPQKVEIAATTYFESEKPDMLIAHPNPFEDKVDVDVSKLALENITLTVLDASGVVVYEKSFSASSVISKVEVDLSGVEAGIYLLQTKKGQDLTTTKLYKF